jgi:hypothetical protein
MKKSSPLILIRLLPKVVLEIPALGNHEPSLEPIDREKAIFEPCSVCL